MPRPFSWFRECAYQVLHGDESDLASSAEFELALHQLVASLQGQLGFGEFGRGTEDQVVGTKVHGLLWVAELDCCRETGDPRAQCVAIGKHVGESVN